MRELPPSGEEEEEEDDEAEKNEDNDGQESATITEATEITDVDCEESSASMSQERTPSGQPRQQQARSQEPQGKKT